MKKTLLALAAALLLAGIAVVQQLATAKTTALPTEEAPKVGYLAPAFELKTLDGGTLGIARGERDKPVILNFWASWCDPCRMEAPLLAELYDAYGDKIDIYGVNGTLYDDKVGIEAFLKQYQIRYPTLLDERNEVFKLYQVPGYPTSVFIDKRGVVREIVIGLPGYEEFRKKVADLAET